MAQATISPLTIGAKAPAFEAADPSGRRYSLSSFRDQPFLTVIFLANHCPYVGAWEDRIVTIANEFTSRGVAFVAISSNDISKFPADSPEEMAKRAQEKGYPFPYLHDEDQSIARAFGATRTPEVFLFDRDRVLRYHGAVDSDWEEASDEMRFYLHDALHQLTATGNQIILSQTAPVGCSIKWKE